jgi:hypothetical protein
VQREVSFCRKGKMSICTARTNQQQIECCFYEKSRFADRCMYFIFEEYCDNLKAQLNADRLAIKPRPHLASDHPFRQ